MKQVTVSLVFFFISLSIFSQAAIQGKVVDATNGQALIGATVRIDGTNIGTATDFDGKFKLDNPADGQCTLIVSMISYKPWTQKINCKTGEDVVIDVKMETDIVATPQATVKDHKVTNTENAVLVEIKKQTSIVSGISASQIIKSQDPNAAEVAKRIPGVTVVDGRFVIVRGLSQRYNAVLLNNVSAPSVEADVKAFSFDLIPSSMIDRFLIFKSPSPDLPGEFAGGAIKIYTKNIPDHNLLSISYTSSYRSGTTLKDFDLNSGSKTDWLGYDNGYRDLPTDFPASITTMDQSDETKLDRVGQSLNNDWGYKVAPAKADVRVGLNLAKRFDFKNWQIGNITSINYSNTREFRLSHQFDYNDYDSAAHQSDTIFKYIDHVYSNKARIGILHNWAVAFGNQKIELKNILNQSGDNETTIRTGSNYEQGSTYKEYAFHYTEKTIYTGQLGGIHEFNNKNTKFDWTVGYSLSKRNEPDWKRIRYTQPYDDTITPYSAYFSTAAQPFYGGRLYINLNEHIYLGGANFEQTFNFKKWADFKPKVKAGVYYEDKHRTYDVRNLGYAIGSIFKFDWNIPTLPLDSIFAPQNINSQTGLKIDEDTKKADSYKAANRNLSYYGMASIPFLKKANLTGGVRVENNLESLNSNSIQGDTIIVNDNVRSILPSVNLTYNLTSKMLVRAAYGKTVNRPEFRELAPLYFYDFVFNAIYSGDTSLKTPTIDNYDVRWEFYPNTGEVVSVAGFYKHFINPIEMYFVNGAGGGTRAFSYRNAPEATSLGAEIEVRKTLSGITKSPSLLDKFSLLFNGAIINSNIILSKDSSNTATKERPMMGQSPYIVNTGIYYQDDSIKLQASILYNVVGPRVAIVGIPGTPAVYEMPRGNLDFTITKSFGKHLDLRFAIQNMLNRPFLLLQDANNDGKLDRETDQSMQNYQTGSYYSLGVVLKL